MKKTFLILAMSLVTTVLFASAVVVNPKVLEAFKKELSAYNSAKGSVQFPIDKPMPLALITKIVKYRVKENLEKASLKKKKI